ncbi:hypothetical protein F1880_008144 [Penicillium rolfsii]|nr:hypothetical protein F1880_008144 [Penicillium rolfsii]
MASSPSQPDPNTQPPASNGISHEVVGLSNENNEHSSEESAQAINDLMEQTDKAQKDLLKLQDDIATLRQSFANTLQTVDRLRELVLTKSDHPHDASR